MSDAPPEETATKRRSGCGICGVPGHNRRTCPKRDELEETQRDETGRYVGPNATSFKPGCAPGPGRPAGKPSLEAAILRVLRKAEGLDENGVPLEDEDGRTLRGPTVDELAKNLLRLAMRGDRTAMKALTTILDRLDGKVPERHEISGRGGEAITISADSVRKRLLADLELDDERRRDEDELLAAGAAGLDDEGDRRAVAGGTDPTESGPGEDPP